jgi:hypothetical protein
MLQNIFFKTFLSNTLNLCPSIKATDHVVNTYKTFGQIIALKILIFGVLDGKWDNSFRTDADMSRIALLLHQNPIENFEDDLRLDFNAVHFGDSPTFREKILLHLQGLRVSPNYTEL